MLLIGLKNETTGVGHSENDYSSVTHQRMDIIAGSPQDTTKDIEKLYNDMVAKGKISQKELGKLDDNIEFSDMSEHEYNKLSSRLLADVKILKYDRVLIIEGTILK
jgi:polyhydroxyalkanoate synthesis regulator phasin